MIPYKSRAERQLEREIAEYKRKVDMLEIKLERIKGQIMPELGDVLRQVAISTTIPMVEILGRQRHRPIADARCIFIHIACDVYRYSKSEVARFLGRDHSTIIHALNSYSGKVLEAAFGAMASAAQHNVRVNLNRQPKSRKSILEQ